MDTIPHTCVGTVRVRPRQAAVWEQHRWRTSLRQRRRMLLQKYESSPTLRRRLAAVRSWTSRLMSAIIESMSLLPGCT